MVNWISKINIKAKHILSDKIIDVFNFEPKKWINIFYCPNWFWKSTLFKILKEVFSFDGEFLYDIPYIEIDWFHLYSITIDFNIWDKRYPLVYEYKNDRQLLERKFDVEDLVKKIYNQKEIIKNKEKDKKSFMDSRTTAASLNRYWFINSDRILSTDWNWSSIIDSHKDWKAKWVLFDYILWMELGTEWTGDVPNLNSAYYFCKNEYKINQYKKELAKWQKDDKKKFWLFEQEQQEKMRDLSGFEDDLREMNIATMDLSHAIYKLQLLLQEIKWKEEFSDFEIIINEELQNLNSIKDEYEKHMEDNRSILKDKIDEYKDWIESEEIKYVKLTKDIEDLEKENLYLNPAYDKYKKKQNNNRKDFNKIYKQLLKDLNYEKCDYDLDELKIKVDKIVNASEATLKICRILFFISLQKLKSENDKIRNLWIWFYDWVLDWVWYDKIMKLLQITKWFNVQTFYFIPKLVDWNDVDSFENKLIELYKSNEIKLYEKWDKEKIFSK